MQEKNGQQPYLYRQAIQSATTLALDQPQRIRLLLDELRQTKIDLTKARLEAEALASRLADAEEAKQTLMTELRHCQQQGSRWHKRLRQTEALLKRVIKQYRELSRRVNN